MSELSPETEELLARGREGTPLTSARRHELKGAVLAKLAIGAAGTGVATTSTGIATWTVTTKTIGVAVIAAVIGSGTVGVVKYERHAHAPQVVAQTSAIQNGSTPTNDAPALPTASAIAITTPAINLPPEAPQNIPIVQPTLDVVPPTPIAHASAPATTTPISNGSPNAVNSPAIVTSPNSGSAGAATTPSTPAPVSSLETDTALIRAAQEALLAHDPARALRLLDEHAVRFPSSALEPEESSERVFAFCAEKNTDAARAAAGKFLSAHPTGPLALRVRGSCGGH
jgi:hypothetical protein